MHHNVIIRFLNALPINKVNALGGWNISYKIYPSYYYYNILNHLPIAVDED